MFDRGSIFGFLFAASTFFFVGAGSAEECDSAQFDRASEISQMVSRVVVEEQFLGGRDIIGTVNDCEYDEEADEFRIGAHFVWIGAVIGRNEYAVDGLLFSDWDAENPKFEFLQGNSKAESLRFWGNLAGKTIEIALTD